MDMNIDQIRSLADLAIEKRLVEITVADGEKSVTIKTQATPILSSYYPGQNPLAFSAASPVSSHEILSQTSQQAEVKVNESPVKPVEQAPLPQNFHAVTSPMVGTFYRAPSPESPPFVEVGQHVSIGQTLCIIEAMKLLNELESEVSGKIVQILMENGQPVEFGQPLFMVET